MSQSRKVYSTKSVSVSYAEYLKTPHWVALRKRLVGRPILCYGCNRVQARSLHHLHYNRYEEGPDDLVPTCKDCHTLIHETLKKRYPDVWVSQVVARTGEVWVELFGKTLEVVRREKNWLALWEGKHLSQKKWRFKKKKHRTTTAVLERYEFLCNKCRGRKTRPRVDLAQKKRLKESTKLATRKERQIASQTTTALEDGFNALRRSHQEGSVSPLLGFLKTRAEGVLSTRELGRVGECRVSHHTRRPPTQRCR